MDIDPGDGNIHALEQLSSCSVNLSIHLFSPTVDDRAIGQILRLNAVVFNTVGDGIGNRQTATALTHVSFFVQILMEILVN